MVPHSVLASRIMFNLRKSSYHLQSLGGTTDPTLLSGMVFSTSPSGLHSTDPSLLVPSSGVTSIDVDVDTELAMLESQWDSR